MHFQKNQKPRNESGILQNENMTLCLWFVYNELGIKLTLPMLTAISYSRWRFSRKLQEKNADLSVLYQAKLIFKWKGKKKIFQHKRLRLGNTETIFGINIRGTLQKKGNTSKRKPRRGPVLWKATSSFPFHCAEADPRSSELCHHPSRWLGARVPW